MGAADDLLLLAEIIAAGGLTAASRKTGISKSTLSRRMDDLEKALGGISCIADQSDSPPRKLAFRFTNAG
jgi:DNA-binding IclR family transcriptional regulator